jgi:hypothetical protein
MSWWCVIHHIFALPKASDMEIGTIKRLTRYHHCLQRPIAKLSAAWLLLPFLTFFVHHVRLGDIAWLPHRARHAFMSALDFASSSSHSVPPRSIPYWIPLNILCFCMFFLPSQPNPHLKMSLGWPPIVPSMLKCCPVVYIRAYIAYFWAHSINHSSSQPSIHKVSISFSLYRPLPRWYSVVSKALTVRYLFFGTNSQLTSTKLQFRQFLLSVAM